jgi:Uma2 family endonuclease
MSRTARHFAVEDSPRDAAAGVDERVRLHGVPWADYERLVEIRGESAVPRMTYLQGELELMTPSHPHERIKKMLRAAERR